MARHRIFVIWKNPIFRDSLRMLLNHPDVEVVGNGNVLEQAALEIAGLKPNTILVEITSQPALLELLEILENEKSYLQIIGMNMDNNLATLIQRESRVVFHEDELLEIILKKC